MMMKYSFKKDDIYTKIFNAVESVFKDGYRTIDIMSPGLKQVGTSEMGDLIVSKLLK
jgi:3-isopropylmalate dehydrogenase